MVIEWIIWIRVCHYDVLEYWTGEGTVDGITSPKHPGAVAALNGREFEDKGFQVRHVRITG